jgi:MFS family permease
MECDSAIKAWSMASIFRHFVNLKIFNVFRNRNFPLIFLSTSILSLANYVITVSIGWLTLEITNSPLSLGMVWAARSAPNLIWGLLAGAVADKVDKRKLMIEISIVLAISAFSMGLLISKDWIQLWHILLYSFILGSLQAFDMTARQAFVFEIVGRKDAMTAIFMNAVGLRMMGIFGGAIAGIIIETMDIAWAFYILVTGYGLELITLLLLRREIRKACSEQQQKKSAWKHLFEGLKIIFENQLVTILMILAILCQILGFSHKALLPIFARDILKVGAVGLGMFTTVQSVGGLLGTLSLATLGDFKHKGLLMLGIYLSFGLFLVLFAQSSSYQISLIFLGIVGGMAATFDAMQHTLLQLNVKEEQLGRAMGIWQLSIGFDPVGQVAVGIMAGILGPELALTLNGFAMIATFLLIILCVPQLHRV